jgi:hypothetical protein
LDEEKSVTSFHIVAFEIPGIRTVTIAATTSENSLAIQVSDDRA